MLRLIQKDHDVLITIILQLFHLKFSHYKIFCYYSKVENILFTIDRTKWIDIKNLIIAVLLRLLNNSFTQYHIMEKIFIVIGDEKFTFWNWNPLANKYKKKRSLWKFSLTFIEIHFKDYLAPIERLYFFYLYFK